MKMRYYIFCLEIYLTMVLAGCYSVSSYTGDGVLVDNGIFEANERFVLNFGEIALIQKSSVDYIIESLPNEEFVFGFLVEHSDLTGEELSKLINSKVEMTLSGTDGRLLFSKTEKLGEWTWSTKRDLSPSFVYGYTGENGSTFASIDKSKKYVLRVVVHRADASELSYRAVVLAKSGGWK